MVKNFFETIESRRSVRKFKSDSISDEMLQKIIAAGCLAPSAGNVQPWKFYIIRQQENKELLARAAGQSFVAQAPVVVVVVAEPEEAAAKYGDRGRELYSIQDTAAAAENILLSACALGLGGCWVGAFSEEAVSRILNLSPAQRPVVIIPIGYPQYTPRTRNLKPQEEVVLFFD